MMVLVALIFLVLQLSPFDKGRQFIASGKTDAAVTLWASAFDSSASDIEKAGLGLLIIKTVSAYELSAFERMATEKYYQTLELLAKADSSKLLQESERLIPIVSQTDGKQLKEAASKSAGELAGTMYNYWLKLDEIPATKANETLIRHFKRIQIAKRRFNRLSEPPYGADDRATIFVRYGEPFKIKNLNCRVSEFRNPFNRAAVPVLIAGSLSFDVEVWTYFLPGTKERVVFYFGENPENGKKFGQVIDLMELVPIRNNWSPRVFDTDARLQPSQVKNLMRFAAMQSLAQLSEETATYYQDLENMILTSGTERTLIQTASNAVAAHNSRVKADYDLKMDQIPVSSTGSYRSSKISTDESVDIWRFFTDEGEPALIYRFTADVSSTIPKKRKKGEAEQVPAEFTARFDIHSGARRDPVFLYQEAPKGAYNVSAAIKMPHQPQEQKSWLVTWFSAPERVVKSALELNEPVAKSMVWSFSFRKPLFNPSPVEAGEIMVSDLMVGKLNDQPGAAVIPVFPAGKGGLSRNDTAFVYFEVLKMPELDYSVDIEVRRAKEKSAGKMLITLNLKKMETVEKEYMQIPIREVRPGVYDLYLTFRSGGFEKSKQCPVVIRR